jgi:FkbM family methyltransferase
MPMRTCTTGRSGATFRKLAKLVTVVREPVYRPALRHGVAAAVEHDQVPFTHDFRSVVDVGAGRGQFALVARRRFPRAAILCFEPVGEAREKLAAVTRGLAGVEIRDVALGASTRTAEFHVSRNLDSSSLLPMTPAHLAAFPNTETTEGTTVSVARLDEVLEPGELEAPTLLKIDAQGYELEVLRGAESLLPAVQTVLVECSFVELYAGQALADDVTCLLRPHGFRLRGIFSVAVDRAGECLQGDFLFEHDRRRDAHATAP